MENASKALLIAAAVLIVILLVAFGMRIFNSTSETAKSATYIGNEMNQKTKTASQSLVDMLNGKKDEGTVDTDTGSIKVKKITGMPNKINSNNFIQLGSEIYIYQFQIKIEPENATNQRVNWEMYLSDGSKLPDNQNLFFDQTTDTNADVEMNGLADFGKVTLIATAQDGSGVQAKCIIDTSGFCFKAGTKILTQNGLKNIEDIKVGDKVYSRNENTSDIELKEVLEVYRNSVEYNICKVSTQNDILECTEEHKFYEKTKGWIEAYKLKNEDILINNNGEEVKITKVEIEKSKYKQMNKVYNIKVKDNHNYFVGKDKILVHNAGCPTF